ncbi:alpha/beta-hydrolase family protein [Aquamicrobium sp. LC103]|uniref:alpha/beta hydrolase n=1 Tax=Aquamicrobium sp. LC103 TaxID=1120658 RepID=UPI001FED3475|nr:alpha/beta-hydrolase family protein [Aquamicrobium sp. LC103]
MSKLTTVLPSWLFAPARTLSVVGILLGTLFFAASLTPSLLPRAPLMQGVLSGCSFAAGYGIGVFSRWLWTYMGFRLPNARFRTNITWLAGAACAVIVLIFLWREAEWQNSVRTLMGLEPVHSAQPLTVGTIALAVFAVLIVVARLFALTFRLLSRWLERYVPRRVSRVIGIFLAVGLFWSIVDGVLFRFGLRVADSSFQQFDELMESGVEKPTDPLSTGSAASLINWDEMGRAGREFISTGPTKEEMDAYFGAETLEPIRVFVGLNSAGTAEERAKLALDELKRVGAFERSLLVIATPTGTGWMDPAATDTLDYLHRGDVATVAVQYSYLTSWLSLLVEPGYGAETARALFKEVYEHWTHLPHDSRPKLYVYGLSLGALNSSLSSDVYDIIGDPYQGALWAGPPFNTPSWRAATAGRNPGSPAWLPRFRDGSVIRFTDQHNALEIPGAEWGPMRIIYLQYASDPVTFFDPQSFYRQPAWMYDPRGADVTPELRWFPIVTFLQLLLDMAAATTAPIGYGHLYSPVHYIDAWAALTDPEGWDAESIAKLKADFAARF